jgi:thioredoxin 1
MKTSAIAFIFFLVLSNSITGQIPDSLKFKSIVPGDFLSTYQKEERAILIDVREPFEYRKSRLKGAVNIPSSGNMDFAADTINKERSIFLYCTSGFRSKRVAKVFCAKGFSNVYSLEGGIVAWRKAGMTEDKKRIRGRK